MVIWSWEGIPFKGIANAGKWVWNDLGTQKSCLLCPLKSSAMTRHSLRASITTQCEKNSIQGTMVCLLVLLLGVTESASAHPSPLNVQQNFDPCPQFPLSLWSLASQCTPRCPNHVANLSICWKGHFIEICQQQLIVYWTHWTPGHSKPVWNRTLLLVLCFNCVKKYGLKK